MTNTGITLCGCSSSKSPAFTFPSLSTPASCLSTGSASHVSKKSLTFSQNIGQLKFTCNTDAKRNPFQDCLNSIAAVCNPSYIGNDPSRVSNCRNTIDTIADGLNSYWQDVRSECGQWSFKGRIGSSSGCTDAVAALRANAYYVLPDGSKSYVTFQLTESLRVGLWQNPIFKQ